MVKEPIVNFGICGEGGSIEVEWELSVDPSEVIHFSPECGCTSAPYIDGNVIKTIFTEDDAKGLTAEQKKNWYPSGQLPISKSITVYLKDDKDLIVFDKNNKTIFNEEKRQEKIGFVGYCKFNSVNGADPA